MNDRKKLFRPSFSAAHAMKETSFVYQDKRGFFYDIELEFQQLILFPLDLEGCTMLEFIKRVNFLGMGRTKF